MSARKPRAKRKSKRYRLEFSRTSVFFWSLGSLFFLAWIFVLGILVGRGFLPEGVSTLSKLRMPITKLQNVVTNRKESDLDRIKGLDKDPEFKFYDDLSTKKEKAASKTGPSLQSELPRSNLTQQREKDETFSKKEQVASISQPSITKNEGLLKRDSVPVGKGTNGWFTVQIASVENKIEARKMVDQLAGLGYPAYAYDANINGKTYYRVRCGKFRDRKEAAEFKELLAQRESVKGFVTKEALEKSELNLEKSAQQPRQDRGTEPSRAGGGFTVQIASLANREGAIKMAERLKSRGYPVYLHKVNINAKTYYRVRCGNFEDKEEARSHQKQLARQEKISGFVTKAEN